MMKRIISLLAAFCLLLTMMPTTVWAKTITNTEMPDKPTMTEFRQPQITGLEKLDQEPTVLIPEKDMPSINDNGEYLSVDDAVAELRKQMMSRAESITIKVKTTNDDASALFTSLFYDAMEHTGEPGAGDNLMWQWGFLSAGNGYGGYYSGGYYYYTLPYEIDYYTTAAMEAELNDAVDALLDDLNLYNASDYDKISGVYEYITENITYDYYNLERDPNYEPMYTAYGALVDGTAVCQGYANLFYRLMLELDVDNRIVVGWAGGPHAWNIVELEDWYYYVDSTWDASFVQEGWDFESMPYFLLGSYYFSTDHTDYVDECPFLPDYPISYTDYVPGEPGQPTPPETWPKSGDCGDDMTWTLSDAGVLTISGTGEMWDFEYSDPEWYPYTNYIRECVVEEGVTELGDYAFYKCYSLGSIELPDSLQYTGEGAFTYCESLTDVTIPDNVTAIGRQTFAGCSALHTVTIPTSVLRIGEIAFLYCYSLQDVYYGGSPSQWNQIEIQEDNECLLDATIHYGAEDTEPDPEPGTEPDPDPDPGLPASGKCGDDLTWTLDADGLLTITGFGAMWDYPSDEPGWYAYVDQVRECVIGDGISSIGTWAFWDCWALEKVTIGLDVNSIGEGAFSYCSALREVTIPVAVTTIEDGAFYDCLVLSDVYYAGSEAQWSRIAIGELNEELLCAAIHFGITGDEPVYPEADFQKVEWEVLRETNRRRAEAGLLPLTTTETLFQAADIRALELAEVYSHTRPDGNSFDSILAELGIGYRMAGENKDAGPGTAKEEVSLWMGTVDGSDKILSTFYTHVGVGCQEVPNTTYGVYWDQLFYTDEYCHYTGFELNTDGIVVEQYAGLEDAQLWGIATCGTCGVCYLPILEEYCIGFDPDTPGTQMVTVSCLDFSDTLEITVTEAEQEPEVEVLASGACGDNLTWTLDANGVLTISGTGGMWDFSVDYPGWYDYLYQVLECVIEDGVNTISPYAFYEMAYMTSVQIPDSVNVISEGAFAYCYRLKTVTMGANIFRIEYGAFCDCYNLEDVYYAGSESQWNQIYMEELNEYLLAANIHFGAEDPDDPIEVDYLKEEWDLLRLMNQMRQEHGLLPYTTNELLFLAADIRAVELEIHHNPIRPNDLPYYTVLDEVGYSYEMAGENDAAGERTAADVVDAWKKNDVFWSNMLFDFDGAVHVGVGYNDNGHYWDVLFAAMMDCHYSDMRLNVDTLEVAQGTGLEDMPLWITLTCPNCGDCYLPILPEYCGGYDPGTPGTQTVTVTCLGLTDTLQITVLGEEPDPEDPVEPDPGTGCGMSEEAVYEILIGMKDEYYEGRPWTNDDSYRWNINYTTGYGCAAFAFILSDAAFGYLPSQTIYDDITIDDLRVGDILRVYDDSHSVVVLEVHDDYIVIAEGNYNNSIHWGRTMSAEEVAADTDYVITRYPEHSFVDGVCTECGAEDENYEPPVEYGDVNADGKINTLDLVLLRKFLTGEDESLADAGVDINGDGKTNTLDLILLRKYLNGEDVVLGPNN